MRKKTRYYNEETNRGRPRGGRSRSTMTVLGSIARIAAKHKLEPELLLDSLTEAWIRKESQCGKFKIKCRKIDENHNTFLITHDEKVVAQFPIQIEILQEPEFYKSYIPFISPPVSNNTKKHISELRNRMKGITLNARIVEIPPRKIVNTRYGFTASVSNILLADKTGTIRLSLWNNQSDNLAVGDTVNIEKASVTMQNGELQLRIRRNKTINVDTCTR